MRVAKCVNCQKFVLYHKELDSASLLSILNTSNTFHKKCKKVSFIKKSILVKADFIGIANMIYYLKLPIQVHKFKIQF